MSRGLSISNPRPRRLLPHWRWWTRWRHRRGRHRRLHQQVHALRDRIHRLEQENRVLTERNDSVEKLSAELMQFNLDLSHTSRLDPLTGLLNRAAFEACLAQEHALSAASLKSGRPRPYSVLMIDVDHFKFYNDSRGHPAGDRCLVDVAGAISASVRRGDFVGRYGGEEVIVLCPGLDHEDAHLLAHRVHQAVRDLDLEHPHPDAGTRVTVSIGLAVGGLDDSTPNGPATVLAADRMLYRAKHTGRDRVVAA
jgi:diguanylate cyclase (GGDEF)-like protein